MGKDKRSLLSGLCAECRASRRPRQVARRGVDNVRERDPGEGEVGVRVSVLASSPAVLQHHKACGASRIFRRAALCVHTHPLYFSLPVLRVRSPRAWSTRDYGVPSSKFNACSWAPQPAKGMAAEPARGHGGERARRRKK